MGERSFELTGRPVTKHALYRFYNDGGQLLYTGITNNPERRFGEHAKEKHWWGDVRGISVDWYDDRGGVLAAESRAIRIEKPLHNVQGREIRPVQLDIQTSPVPGLARSLAIGAFGEENAEPFIANIVKHWDGTENDTEAYSEVALETVRLVKEQCLNALKDAEQLARVYLDSLDSDEAEEWISCAAEILDADATWQSIVIWASQYASNAVKANKAGKSIHTLPGMCLSWGEHGAKCPNRATYDAYLATCGEEECTGHRLCGKHLEQLVDGTSRKKHDVIDFKERESE